MKVRVTNYWIVASWDPASWAEYLPSHQGDQKVMLTNGMYVILPAAFVAAVEMEGWGAIRGGMIAYTEKGWELSPKGPAFPWGLDARGRALKPFYSIAVDPKVIPLGTKWVSDWAGRVVTPDGPWDGTVLACDTGGGIKGNHIDLFVGFKRDRVDLHYQTGKVTPDPWEMELTPLG